MAESNSLTGNIVFLSHGGGPFPIIGGMGHDAMIEFLKKFPSKLPVPDEILVISAHWEESLPTVNTGEQPSLYFDYSGFPPETYQYQYPAPSNPTLAMEVRTLLEQQGIATQSTDQRGWDHGVFIPLMLSYPKANIPITQLSLIRNMNALAHVQLGNALQSLLERNILIIGSGFSFHNLRSKTWENLHAADPENDVFQDWLIETCTGDLSVQEIESRLIDWENAAPHARYCHPREEHLLPLFVCQAAAGARGKVIFDDKIAGKRSLGFHWPS